MCLCSKYNWDVIVDETMKLYGEKLINESIGSTPNRLGCSKYPGYFFIKDTFNKL